MIESKVDADHCTVEIMHNNGEVLRTKAFSDIQPGDIYRLRKPNGQLVCDDGVVHVAITAPKPDGYVEYSGDLLTLDRAVDGIHYSGGLEVTKSPEGLKASKLIRISGTPACCEMSTDRSWTIMASDLHTKVTSDVTCKMCLALIGRADRLFTPE